MTKDEVLEILLAEASKDIDKSSKERQRFTEGLMQAYSHAYGLVIKIKEN